MGVPSLLYEHKTGLPLASATSCKASTLVKCLRTSVNLSTCRDWALLATLWTKLHSLIKLPMERSSGDSAILRGRTKPHAKQAHRAKITAAPDAFCLCALACLYVFVCLSVYIYAHVCLCVYAFIWVCVCVYVYVNLSMCRQQRHIGEKGRPNNVMCVVSVCCVLLLCVLCVVWCVWCGVLWALCCLLRVCVYVNVCVCGMCMYVCVCVTQRN